MSFHQLGLDYVDVYLIHFPAIYERDPKVWAELERFKEAGKAK